MDTNINVYWSKSLQDVILKKLSHELLKPMALKFSARCTTTQIQDLVMAGLDKRKKGEEIDDNILYTSMFSIIDTDKYVFIYI